MANLQQRASMVITHVLGKQRLLLESYIRNACTVYIPIDIINLCSIFFQIHIKLLNSRDYIMNNNDFYQLCKRFYQQCEYYLSYEILLFLLEYDEYNYKYHNMLGRVFCKWEMYEAANKEFKIAIELNPYDYHILCMNGISLMKQSKHYLALQEFIKAGEIAPKKSKYLLYSVDCYTALNQHDDAKRIFVKLLETVPDKSTKQLYYCMKFAKFLHAQTIRNYSDIQEYFEKAIGIQSHNWAYIHQLSNYLGYNYSENYHFYRLEHYNSNYAVVQRLYESNQLKWCQIMNFFVKMHYDIGIKSGLLKPKTMSLGAEFLAYLANRGFLNDLFDTNNDSDVKQNYHIRMAVLEAVKYYQEIKITDLHINELFDLNNYSKTNCFCYKNKFENKNDSKMEGIYQPNKELIEWFNDEVCNEINWKFKYQFFSRFETLLIYLKRLGFNAICINIISKSYADIRQDYTSYETTFSTHVKFGFLCRYLLEITYYNPIFYSYAITDLIVSIIWSSYTIAEQWPLKFNFHKLLHSAANLCKIIRVIRSKHQSIQIIGELSKMIINMGRKPHLCHIYCVPVYFNNTHYHKCKCSLNCCLATYLKYGKTAFCKISHIPGFVKTHVNSFK